MAHKYSYSQISCYASCPLKYRLRYIDQLVPFAGESAHDLLFGRAIDAALNAWYMPYGTVAQAQEAFAASYPASRYPANLPSWAVGKTFSNGLAAIAAYPDWWREEDQHWEIISIQSNKLITVADEVESLDRLVRLDLVVRDDRDGMIYGVDHKTTGKYLDKDYWPRFSPHSQIRQYVYEIQRKYGECGGFYINALSFKHRSKAYTPRVGPDKGVQLPAGDWFNMKRMVFNPNAEAVRAEQANWGNWTSKIELDKTTGDWAYNTDQCVRGPLVCEYHRMCDAGFNWPEDAELISNDYRRRCIRLAKDGERCWLEPEHEGEHDSTPPFIPDAQIELDNEIEIEEAESA